MRRRLRGHAAALWPSSYSISPTEQGGRKHFLGVALPRGPADAICSNWAEFFLLFIPLLVVASASVHFGVQKPIASRLSRYIGK